MFLALYLGTKNATRMRHLLGEQFDFFSHYTC